MMRFLPAVAVALTIVAHPEALAGGFYVETGIGAGKMLKAAQFFGAGAPDSPSLSLAFSATLGFNLSSASSLVQLHLGMQYRTITGREGDAPSTEYVFQSIYPMFRMETPRFYFGGGITPLAARQINTPPGMSFIRFDHASGLAVLAQVGLLWRVYPEFFLALEGSAQGFRTSGGDLSPFPTIEASLNLRFLFGDGDRGAGSASSSSRYDGWRYPFGLELFYKK